MMFFLYLLSIAISYFVFRELVKLHSDSFVDVDLKDLVMICTMLVLPVFNLVITLSMYVIINRKTGEGFKDILKKMFMVK
jgi:amino acid permease